MKKSQAASDFVEILSLPIPHIDKKEASRWLRAAATQRTRCVKVYTPNPQMALRAYRSPETASLFCRADLLLPDGIGMVVASHLLKNPLPERIAGIDAARFVLSVAAEEGLAVAFLGAKPTVAETAAARLQKELPALRVCYTHHGYFDRNGEENEAVLTALREAKPDILFVCFGFPAQEEWIDRCAKRIPSLRLCMGLGGSLDVWSGNVRRAPRAVQSLGGEWLWRMLREPHRLRTLPDLPRFLFLVLRSKQNKNFQESF